MKFAVLRCGDALIGYAAQPENNTLGAYVPGIDGNYYSNLILIGNVEPRQYSMSAQQWWDWVKTEALVQGSMQIDEDFPFDPSEVEIVIVEI